MSNNIPILNSMFNALVHICVRPRTYPVQTFRELVAFIDGFELGTFVAGQGSKAGKMEAFGKWLAERSNDKERKKWSTIVLELANGDEEIAITQLGRLMKEYISSDESK